MQKKERLKQLFLLASDCDENDPYELANKLIFLSQAQEVIGELMADAVKDYNRAYARRKSAEAEAYLSATKNKAQMAEIAVTELRIDEGDLEAEKVRWQRAYESNDSLINALKYKERAHLESMRNANLSNGSVG